MLRRRAWYGDRMTMKQQLPPPPNRELSGHPFVPLTLMVYAIAAMICLMLIL